MTSKLDEFWKLRKVEPFAYEVGVRNGARVFIPRMDNIGPCLLEPDDIAHAFDEAGDLWYPATDLETGERVRVKR